jgi:glycosyltransferase involved in cell wall biosynthesis
MSQPRRTLRVLLIAEAANPDWVSVPLVGWNIYRSLSKIVDVHLVTHVRNRAAISRAGLIEVQDYTAIDNERIAGPLYRLATMLRGGEGKGWTTVAALSSIAYYAFEMKIWQQFRKKLESREFDIVHRVTPLSPTSQSILAKRLSSIGVPFIVGPLNGGVPWPPHFIARQHAEHEWLSHIRNIYKLMPAYGSTRRFSSAIIVGSKFTYGDMPASVRGKCVYIPENGIWRDQIAPDLPRREERERLRAVFVGRLVPYKGADMLLEGASEFLRDGKMELHIVGDGPQRVQLEALANTLGIRDAVAFHGHLSHSDALRRLEDSDFMIFPSIREFGGGVVIESMAMGVPPIVADYAGPAELVDSKTGIKISFSDRATLVEGIRTAIVRIIERPALLRELGLAARDKVRERYTWEAKAVQILKVYDQVISGTRDFTTSNPPNSSSQL